MSTPGIERAREMIVFIEDALSTMPAAPIGHRQEDRDQRKKATQDLAERIRARVGPKDKIDDRPAWENTRVRIFGIQSTCTYGLEGALRNWCVAAKKKLIAS